MDWAKRINAVLDYIEENLDGELDDRRIAAIFASPQGMFQRVFSNITGMALSAYIRKRKLTRAAFDLMDSDEKIIDVALRYGYDSPVAFSAAFKRFHGAAPSAARKLGFRPQSFRRLTFNVILSDRGVDAMQLYSTENAEYIMGQMVNPQNEKEYFRRVAEHNGTKCACDGFRAVVMLPQGAADWDLSDAYFDTGDAEIPRFELDKIFRQKDGSPVSLHLAKEQAAVLLVALDGARTDHQRKLISLPASDIKTPGAMICVDMNGMRIITEEEARAVRDRAPVMAFQVRLIEEALKFLMCSDEESITVYYCGELSPLIMKSGRLYALVLPLRLMDA